MEYNLNKTLKKGLIAVSLFIVFIMAPVQSAHAQFFGGIVHDPILTAVVAAESTRKTVKDTADSIAMKIAQIVLERIVSSTVKWAQSGFEGNPAYVTNPQQYFTDLADGIAGNFIKGSDLAFICSPFQANIRLSLMQEYYEPQPFQCTLSEVTDNIEGFFDDFSQGGWDAWFSMTQNPTNNPYGAYLKARVEMDSRIANAVGLEKDQLNWNQGFLSWKKCPAKYTVTAAQAAEWKDNPDIYNSKGLPYQAGDCLDDSLKTTATPGTIIKSQLDKVLPSGLEKLVNAQHIEQLIEAFATGVLKRYVFSNKGLFSSDTSDWRSEGGNALPGVLPGGRFEEIDIDRDGIMDGLDSDSDGEPDSCYFGGETTPLGPPCKGSREGIKNPDTGGGGGGQCSVSGQQYEGALRNAEAQVASVNPEVASLLNLEDANGYKANSKRFLDVVAQILEGQGYNATTDVLNGHNNPNTGDAIAVWRDGDTKMERYDAMLGGNGQPVSQSAIAEFTGFVPLNCTTSGGGKDCGGCDTGGTTPEPSPAPSPAPAPGEFGITSVTPTVAQAGVTTITITGNLLTNQVSFYDGSGNRNTVVGTVNSAKTQTTVLVPASQPLGNATVKIYQGNQVWSNGILIQISTSAGSGGNIITTSPTSVWTPPQTANGWWPSLSPNGRYVTYGNWGESWVTDLESSSKQTWDFSKPNGLPAGARCIAGQWLSNTKMTFVCEITESSFWRYEVTVGDWTPVKTNDDPSLVVGNMFRARDNHWASYLAAQRITKDNQVIVSGGTGGAIALSGSLLVHSCTNEGASVCVRDGAVLTHSYTAKTPIHNMTINAGYIAYGGYGPVRGLTPVGTDIDLTVTPWRWENTGEIVYVSSTPWVATTTEDPGTQLAYILLRPWGSKEVIAVRADATGISVSVKGSDFVISYNNAKGAMNVITVPTNSARHAIN